jgi:Cu(I)/Ag(I) efflux system periplasmic protein CusF
MRYSTLMTLLAAPLALAACDAGDEIAHTADMPMAEDEMAMGGEDMPMMQSDEGEQTGSGEGTVTAVDAKTITIDHGPIPEVSWPAMTMSFTADEAARQAVTEGDEVTFEFRKTEGGGEITSIVKK